MVAAGGLDGAQRAFVDPLFQRGIAHAQAGRRGAHTDQVVRHPASKPAELTSKIGWYHIKPPMRLTGLRTLDSGLWTLAAVAALAGATAVSGRTQAPSAAIMVFAASDLGPPFAQIAPPFERKTRTEVTLVLGSTGMLAQQIRNG